MKAFTPHNIFAQNLIFSLRLWLCALLVSWSLGEAKALDASHYAEKSKLAEGYWVKVSVTQSGMHQITYNELRKWGFSNPERVSVLGYGGSILPETFSSSDIDDLNLLPILHSENKILFYAQGPISWSPAPDGLSYVHTQNPYSTAGYYFLTDSQEIASPSERSGGDVVGKTDITSFSERAIHEKELYSPGATGRLFLGEDFRYNTVQKFGFIIPGLVTPYNNRGSVVVEASFGAKVAHSSSKLVFSQNGRTYPEESSDIIPAASESSYEFVKMTSTGKDLETVGEDLDFTLQFKANGAVTTARLNYLRFNYERKLQLYKGSIQFRLKWLPDKECFSLPEYTEHVHIWDITNPGNPVAVIPTVSNNTARFVPTQAHEEYIAFDTKATHTSVGYVGVVANQNLHGMETPDLVILTPKEYIPYANQIAQMHEQKDSMKVAVIDHTLVFNEFSSGTPDATAYRRLMKMFFDREGGTQGKQLYLLLFGKGLYDNRKISEQGKYIKYPTLLTYQHGLGSDERSSRSTDDYFGFLDDKSGNSIASDKVRVSIGRLPVKSEQEAKNVES